MPEPSLLSHLRKMGVHRAYFISQCSDAPEHSYRLARAFTALAQTLIGRSYDIFFQPMLRRALACAQSCQTLYCSRTCAKWAYIQPILSANSQTRLKYLCSLARTFTAIAHAQNGRTYGIFHQSMLRRAWAFVPSSQSLHCSRTYTKWSFIWHILSANAQTCLSVCAVLTEP